MQSLYERLGGVYAIAAVVDDFIDRVMDDPRLNANPQVNEAHHRVARAGFKYLVTEQVCAAAGGPQRYTGKSMADSHAHLAITELEWQAGRLPVAAHRHSSRLSRQVVFPGRGAEEEAQPTAAGWRRSARAGSATASTSSMRSARVNPIA